MKKHLLIALCVTLLLFIVGCAEEGSGADDYVPESEDVEQELDDYNGDITNNGEEEEDISMPNEELNNEEIDVPDLITGTIEMEDGGIITFELYHDVAPQAVRNFVYLARDGFYDGLTFHRVIEGFMIQGGCPQGLGIGGPGWNIFGEVTSNGWENNIPHTRGVFSMAHSGHPDSGGSQFFICHADSPWLDGIHPVFGRVTGGMDVVDRIAEETPVLDGNGSVAPEDMPVIRTITIDGDFEVPPPNKLR